MPDIAAGEQVVWPFDAARGDLIVHVRPFAQLPQETSGRPRRINAMASVANRLYVSDERDGQIYDISNGGAVLWFDVAAAILGATGQPMDVNNGFHGGLRGFAFHPNFAQNGKLYVSVMVTRPSSSAGLNYLSDVTSPIGADSALIEWTVNVDTMTVDTNSYRELFRVGMPVYDHPIKQIGFNRAASPGDTDYGNLYIAHGDGSVQSAIAGGGQNNDALGKILRINPLATSTQGYTVPADNPFVSSSGMPPEVYSIGHRNPHHMAFSRAGELLVAEPGRDNIEEINLVTRGGDYGWPAREGTFVHKTDGKLLEGIAVLPDNDADFRYVYPVVQYGHHGIPGQGFGGEAIGGGYAVENGSPLNGYYFFTEFVSTGDLHYVSLAELRAAKTTGLPGLLTQAVSKVAKIRFDHDGDPSSPALTRDNMLQILQEAAAYDQTGRADIRFGQAANGDMYLMSKRNGLVYKITSSQVGGPGGIE